MSLVTVPVVTGPTRDRYGKQFAKYPKALAKVAEQKTEGADIVLLHEIITGRPDKPDPWDAGWLRYEVRDGVMMSERVPPGVGVAAAADPVPAWAAVTVTVTVRRAVPIAAAARTSWPRKRMRRG